MSSRATPAIVLGPTGNLQGTYKFFNLETGKKIKRRHFTLYPMPDSVIAKVEGHARPRVVPGVFDFADRSGILFEWNDAIDEPPKGLVAEDVVLYPSIVTEFPGVTLDRDIAVTTVEDEVKPHGRLEDAAAHNAGLKPVDIAGVDRVALIDTFDDAPNDNEPDDDDDHGIIAIADLPPADPAPDDALVTDDDDDDNVHTDVEHSDNEEEEDNDDGGDNNDRTGKKEADDAAAIAAGLRRSGRKNKGRSGQYANYTLLLHARKAARGGAKRAALSDGVMMFSADDVNDARPIPVEDRLEHAFGVILQQYSIGAGLKKFQERGEKGGTKELQQMHNMSVFRPVLKTDLSLEEMKKAVSSLMFLKEKRDKTVKGRFCADGRKQQGDWTKQDSTSPTVSTESVFLTAVIEARERRDVACYDIPGAFLHADSNEDITMVLKGRLAELMVQVAPNLYRKYITVDKRNTPILYVKIQKALYGLLLRSALLFYQKLVGDLESNGFILNPYDPCVANKDIS